MHKTPSRGRGDGRATGQPQGLGPEAYLLVRRKVNLSCLSRACRGESAEGTPEDARLPAAQNGAAPEAGSCAKQSASGATMCSSMQGRPPGLCTPPRYEAGPHPLLAMTRLCAFVDLPASGGADHPASCHPIAAALPAKLRVPSLSREKPLPQRFSSQSLRLADKDGHSRDRSRWFVHNAG